VIVHGWDLAVATGRRYWFELDPVGAAYELEVATVAQNPTGGAGLFGPPVPVAEALLLEWLIGLTGRDPTRRPQPSNP
jgi:hypothetical protein